MSQHLLIVGDPGGVPRLLRAQQGPSLAMTSLCLTADIPRLAGLRFVDRILATGPQEESNDAWVATAVSAHRAFSVTQAAVFDPNVYTRAAAVADVLGIELYPRLEFAAINDHWAMRQRLRAADHLDVQVARAPDRASLERYVAEHGLPCLLRSRLADRPAALLRSLDDVDRAARGGAGVVVSPGEHMVVESATTAPLFRIAVLVEDGRSEALAVLRHHRRSLRDAHGSEAGAGPVRVAEEDGTTLARLRAQAAYLAQVLGVRDGLVLVELAVDNARVHIGGVRLGPPGEQTQRAVLQATGVDLTLCCARQACGLPTLARAVETANTFGSAAGSWPDRPRWT
ncbi:MAG TPA: hypothetical protein VF714_08300 [Jatrophihabitans sp.]